jgi:hypothetical protein
MTPKEAGMKDITESALAEIDWYSLALYTTEHRHCHESGRGCQYASHDFGIHEEHCQDSNQRNLISDDVEAGANIVTTPLQSARAVMPFSGSAGQ